MRNLLTYDLQLQAHISTAAWQEQSRIDQQHDFDILCQKLDEGRKDDQAMLSLLQMKSYFRFPGNDSSLIIIASGTAAGGHQDPATDA